MIRLGLCCIFREVPVRFQQTTAAALKKIGRPEQLRKVSGLCLNNLDNLLAALQWLLQHEIRAFRVLSPLFPRYTHPEVAYSLAELPQSDEIVEAARRIRDFRRDNDIRLSLHPDQFNVLSSPHQQVVDNTCRELEYQGLLADLIGAEVINVHGGGVYGDKTAALDRFASNFERLSERVRSRLTVENDDLSYSPEDLLQLCRTLQIPFVYDVHHHRCLPDSLSEQEATQECMESWRCRNGEPYFHLSSPRNGWQGGDPRPHSDFIDPLDFPEIWYKLQVTVDVEAKAKELAVLKLRGDLQHTMGNC